MCRDTDEGVFVNIVKKDTCQKVLNTVAVTMAVYKMDKMPTITELSDNTL